MSMPAISRREFLYRGTAFAAIPFLSKQSIFSPSAQAFHIGYSAITWGGKDLDAIKDISGAGYKGIQLRSNVLPEYGNSPEKLKAALDAAHLSLVMFSSGSANINTGNDESVIQQHVSNAKFVKQLGGSDMQITNSSRPKEGNPSKEDLQKFGRLLNEIGRRTQDLGVTSNYHNHMGQLGQTPEEVQIILENCDEKYIPLLLDVAHYQQGGGDPVKAIGQYGKRIKNLHLKDVRPVTGNANRNYQFVELGQGSVDFPSLFKALDKNSFKGWGVVELDAVPDPGKTPLECAGISKAYLVSKGISL